MTERGSASTEAVENATLRKKANTRTDEVAHPLVGGDLLQRVIVLTCILKNPWEGVPGDQQVEYIPVYRLS